MVLSDAVILLVALRTVGVEAEALPVTVVVGAFLLAYPLTLFPLAGLGVLDAVLVAAWTQRAGLEYEPQIVAALIIWRAVSLLVPIGMGAVALIAWRRRTRSASSASPPPGHKDSPE